MRQLQRIFLLGSLSLFSCSLLTRALGAESCDGNEVVCDGTIQKACVNGAFELLECADSGQICDAAQGGCVDNGVCGDGVITSPEQCDSDDVGGADCTTAGFDAGTLTCNNATCTFDISQCTLNTCPNGAIDNGEQCDGNNLNGQSCVGLGFASGTLDCSDVNCQFDTVGCVDVVCGNNIIEAGEECEGNNLGGNDCDSATNGTLPSGTLACSAVDCQFDISLCIAGLCGNGVIDAGDGEECDGNLLGGNNCSDATAGAFPQGTLACGAGNCQFDTAQCGLCGDGIAQPNETCDDACGGNGCNGADNGDGCSSQCALESQGSCDNDNTREGSELCDGTDLAGESCTGLGFAAGTLSCTDCNFDTSTCTR